MSREPSASAADLKEFASWLHERLPPDQDLDQEACAELAVAIGGERRFWDGLVYHDPNTRYFHQLYRDPHLDIWLICWLNAQDTGYHDHDVSSGAVYVVEGRLFEDFFHRDEDGWIREKTHEHTAGALLRFDSSYIHGLRHAGGPPATSIHVYSPALWRMGHYQPDDGGSVRRISITYADELASSV
jgi:Cysteine dioxygenase type I